MIRNRLSNRALRALVLGVLVVSVSACAYLVGSWSGAPGTQSKRDVITFSHNRHLVKEGLACGDCHSDMDKNESLDQKRAIPHENKCMDCHDKKDNCKMCHANPEQPVTLVDHRMEGMVFSHKNHLARSLPGDTSPVTCETCHTEIKDATRVSDNTRPGMLEACSQCHQKDFGRENCTLCHKPGSLGTKTSAQIWDHGGDWLNRHGGAARTSDAVCSHCHKVDTCAECHSRSNVPIRPSQLKLDRPDSLAHHRGDWLSRHPMEARLDSKSCGTCHQQSSCQQCHDRMGVSQTGALGSKTGPHPPGWLIRGSGENHGDAARRDAVSCAACHDRGAASNCVTCHRVGAPGGNPHPPGWTSTQDKQSAAACTPCHQ